MELIFLLVIVIVIIKVAQRGNNRLPRQSDDYQRGYWDGVRDAQNGRAKIEDNDGQAKLITENQAAVSQSTDPTLTSDEGEEPSDSSATDAVPIEENTNIPDEKTQTIQWLSPVSNKEKEKNRQTTINVALYTASLLLTAGILLLAQTIELSAQLRFSLVWLFIFVYYAIGQVLYARLPILKPASTAFIGTALAAVPIGGWSMHLLLGIDPALCWLATSFIGTFLCVDATVRLNSQPLAYISLLSMFTMTTSLPAVMHAQLVWYYAVVLLFGCLMTLAAYFSNHFPRQFTEPLTLVNPFIVPSTLLLAIGSSVHMGTLDVSMLLLISVIYYFTVALVEKSKKMRTYELTTTRVLLMAATASFTMYLSNNDGLVTGIALGVAALGNMVWSIGSMHVQKQPDKQHEIVLWISFVASLAAVSTIAGVESPLRDMIIFILLSMISAVSFMALALLRRARFGGMVVMSGILLVPAGVRLFSLDPITALHIHYSIFMFMAFLPVICRLLVLKRPNITKSQAILVYGTAAAWWLITVFIALAFLNAYPAGEGMLYLSDSVAVATIIMGIAAWREKVYGLVIGIHASLLLMALLIALYFKMAGENLAILMAWLNGLSLLLLVEWLYNYRKEAAVKCRELLLYSAIGAAILIIFSSIHPAVWLPLVALLYYAFYRRREDGYLGGAYLATIALVLLFLHWLDVPLSDNFTITAWVVLVGFGVVYWSLAMNKRASITSDMTLLAATVPAVILPMINLSTAYELPFKILGWLAAVAALYMAVYAKRDWRPMAILAHPSLVLLFYLTAQWLGVKLEFMPIVSLIIFAVFYGAAVTARIKKLSVYWYYASFWSAIGWSMTLLLMAMPASVATEAVLLVTLTWAVNGSALIAEGVPKKNILYFDSGSLLVLCGILFAIHMLIAPVHGIVVPYLCSAAILSGAVMSWRWLGYAHIYTIAHLVLALAVFSLSTLVLALAGDNAMEILFLAEHSLMVIIGLALGKRLISMWGAVGVTLALIYLLSGYAYALAILAGLSIITAVVVVVARRQGGRQK
ncbi:hypothetical protein GWK77_03870 [Candidatus Saccharibacteria bacterium oral taxon 488]|nr:hypothetical protein GWK77_03870 [Candidatus Saccharibacteria bacterium oral taxon 488]